MKYALAAALLAGLAFAAPARADTLIGFEGSGLGTPAEQVPVDGAALSSPCYPVGSVAAAPPVDECSAVTPGGHDSAQSLDMIDPEQGFRGFLEARFDVGQPSVSMWVTADRFGEGADLVTLQAFAGAPGAADPIDTAQLRDGTGPFGQALLVQAPPGGSPIRSVRLFTGAVPAGDADPTGNFADVTVDDIAFAQPDTLITASPATVAKTGDATFAFASNLPAKGFTCTLDGGPGFACTSPFTASGLAAGTHTFTVAASHANDVDPENDVADETPASYSWTIEPPAVVAAPAPTDTDHDGVPDASDDCPGTANGGQSDVDRDGIGDACEVVPNGNVPPVEGESVIVRVLSGTVFVKLPTTAGASRRFAQAISGFVPLKGVASLPVGTVVDARKGSLALSSTVDGRRIGAGGETRTATLSAGIFAIKQRKLREGSRTRVPTDLVLTSPPNATRQCVRTTSFGPVKGRPHNPVRSLTAKVAKGFFRIVGGAAISTGTGATWATTDRCDGTRTEVGKGRVRVTDLDTDRVFTVNSGRSLLIRAALFSSARARQR